MDEQHLHRHEKQTLWVVLLTAVTMVVEVVFGLLTNSMALLADGIHMGSHVLAIGLSWAAYIFVRKNAHKGQYSSHRILSLAGFSSGLLLLIFAFGIIVGAVERLNNPLDIQYREAIWVAVAGLIVNLLSALLLHHSHEEDDDHNLQAAYLHVVADALTSILAIGSLLAAMTWNIRWLDVVCALIGAVVIIRWSVKLIVRSGKSLVSDK